MRRDQLEHLIRAAAVVSDDDTIVVVGSQSVLGSQPDAPAELLRSVEADLYPRNHPERAIVIDGALGEGSPFHDTFGYYAHGVGPETSVLGPGWEDRLVTVQNPNTNDVAGLCLEPHDAVAAKLAAGREHDVAFAATALAAGIVDAAMLRARIDALPVDEPTRAHAQSLLTLAESRS